MDKQQATKIAEKELEPYRDLPYEKILSKIDHAENFEKVDENGKPYKLEVESFFDDSENKNIRVTASVSCSFWTHFSPVSSDFIIAPNGEFIGE